MKFPSGPTLRMTVEDVVQEKAKKLSRAEGVSPAVAYGRVLDTEYEPGKTYRQKGVAQFNGTRSGQARKVGEKTPHWKYQERQAAALKSQSEVSEVSNRNRNQGYAIGD